MNKTFFYERRGFAESISRKPTLRSNAIFMKRNRRFLNDCLEFRHSDLVALLRHRALVTPDACAYVFLKDGESVEHTISFGELDRRARIIAAQLQAKDMKDKRALLIFPAGIDYIAAFLGCLYAGVIAVPIYPPSRHQAQRLKAIIHDASPSVVLTTAYQCEKLSVQFADDWGCGRLTWLITDSSTSLDPDDWMPPGLQSESLAFLQYTSGSTGDPKGVMVSHGNLMANQRMIKQAFHHTRETVVVGWLPLYHDMGLIGNVLQPLYLGATAILMSPLAFLEQPVRWLRAISTYRATTSGGPNFAYELCVRKISSEQKQELDLSCWRVAFNGAEPVRSATLARFFDAFRDCGFRRTAFFPCYGLAESTLFVSGKQLSSNPPPNSEHEQAEQPNHSHKLISSGRSGKDHTVCIVNPLTNILCPDGQEGEIWVAGPSVAQGYWNRPELSAAQFRAVLALPEERLDPNDCHERNIPQTDAAHYTHTYLRTGDLGIIEHGELFVTGRIKDLIILRGRNYYPHDLEQAIDDNVDGIRSNGCAAFSVEQAGEERLIIAVEVRRKKISAQQADELFSQIRQALNDASDAPIGELLLVPPGSILKTSSGKIQRHAIKQAYLHGHCNILARSGQNHTSAITPIADRHSPNHPFQDEWRLLSSAQRMPWMIEFLQSHLAKLLMISPISMTPERSIRTLGLDSLRLVEFKHTIDACLGTELPVAILLSEISIADLARMLVIEMSLTALPDKMPSSQKDVSLSCTQQAIWAVQQSEVDSIANNVHFSLRVDGLLDHVLLQQAVEKLLQRHPQLRTRYHDNGESVQQSVIPCAQLQSYFFSIDATNWSEAALQNDFTQRIRQHFDLAAGPLLRVACYQQSEQVHVILFCAHHVAVDLWTSMIVLHDLKVIMHNLKQGKNDDLPNVIADYQDFVAWQRHYLQSSAGHEDLMFWRQELSGDLPQLTLPIDFSRPLLSEYRGASKTFRLNRELTQQLKQLGQRYGATLFMTLLTVYKVLLHRYTHQNDMIVGTANNGRPQSRFKHVAGYFVNPIAIRTFPHGLLSFTSYLTQVRDKVMGALTHADYPFSLLVEQVQPQRSATHWPIYQTLLIVQQGPTGMDDSPAHLTFGNDGEPVNWGDWTISSKEINEHVENFDLRLMAVEDQHGLILSFRYRTDLFEATTIARMAEHFQLLLEQIIARPDALLSELSLLTESESTRQFQLSNSTSPVLSEKRCLHELFEAQVELTPKHAAVACDGKQLTYAELNRRANQLAHFLRIQGVGPETPVALCLRRSVDMIVAMLGILKAGGAYVPIDPDFPLMRIGSILDDSGARLIITQQALMDKVQIGEIPMLCLDEEQNDILAASCENPQNLGSSDHLAYLIYTSGSTGKSKGVAITHRNVVHSTLARFETYPDPIYGFLLLSSYTFDSSVAGIFWTLCQGGCIHIPVEGAEKDPQLLGKILSTEKISHLLCLPSFYAALLENLPQFLFEQMKVIVVAGEACPVDVVARHHIKLPHVAMFNEYGWGCECFGADRQAHQKCTDPFA